MLSKSVPRTRMMQMWRIPDAYLEQAQDDATVVAIRDLERAERVVLAGVRVIAVHHVSELNVADVRRCVSCVIVRGAAEKAALEEQKRPMLVELLAVRLVTPIVHG